MHTLSQSRIVDQIIKQKLRFSTMKKISSGMLFLAAQVYAANIYALTFDWEAATDDGETVSQTVSGYVATVSTSSADAYLEDLSPLGGSTGKSVTAEDINISSMTVTFSTPINLDTAFVFKTSSFSGNWVFTPAGGSNAVVNQAISTSGTTVNLNWIDVTGFTITNPADSTDTFGVDDLDFTPPPPPHVQSIAVSGIPAADAVSMAYTVTFSENAIGVSTDDFTLTTVSGNAAGQIASVSSSTGTSIDVTVNNISGGGGLRLDLNANTDIEDDAGNGDGMNGFVAAFMTGAVHTVDRIPTITTATYDADTGTLVVTGTNFEANAGALNDVDVSLLTFTGEGGGSYTITDNVDVEIDNATQFTVTLNGVDLTAVTSLLNKSGTSSTDATIYNLAAADDFITAVTAGDSADVTNNSITVSLSDPVETKKSGGGFTSPLTLMILLSLIGLRQKKLAVV